MERHNLAEPAELESAQECLTSLDALAGRCLTNWATVPYGRPDEIRTRTPFGTAF